VLASPAPRLAVVHDALINSGGAERVLTYIHEAFPDAPIYTAAYLPERTFSRLRHATIIPLWGSQLVKTEAQFKKLFPLWVIGFARLDLSEFDVVLTSTTWGAKFVPHDASVRHVSYCYAPNRLLWFPDAYRSSHAPVGVLSRLVDLARGPLRVLDSRATRKIDRLATTCRNMANAIASCYGMRARIIYPPVRLADYDVTTEPGDFYLSVSRLMSHKRIDLAIEACCQLGRKLVVVGDGPEASRLRALSRGAVTFLGRVSDRELRGLYAACRAVIFPSDEDFGLVPLETQAAGRPVIAYASGGALETVMPDRTGLFFTEQTTEAVVEAMERFERMQFDPAVIRDAMARFTPERFTQELHDFVLAA